MNQLPFDWKPTAESRETRPPMQVSDLARRISAALDAALPDPVMVTGEVGTCQTKSSNGHWYFTLRDEHAEISCVMWASDTLAAGVREQTGLAVDVGGSVVHWAPGGRTQIRVRSIRHAGEGDRQAALRRLRAELQAAGWFDSASKQPLPRVPETVAVLTSASAAALHDVRARAAGRWPACRLVHVDIPVQGRAAAGRIAEAIGRVDAAAESTGIDVILLTRGGGSAEDLDVFNDRGIAAALHAARTPTVVAIGHESDTSIAELVADVRASTPTAAVELLLPDRCEEQQRLDIAANLLHRRVTRRVRSAQNNLTAAAASLGRSKALALEQLRRSLGAVETRLAARAPFAVLAARRTRLDGVALRLLGAAWTAHGAAARRLDQAEPTGAATRRLVAARGVLDERASVLEALSPEAVLARGFSLTLDAHGRVVRRSSEVAAGDVIESRLAEGRIRSVVEQGGESSQGHLPSGHA